MNSLIGYVDQRSAEVALDAIAADVAQVHQDMLDADADATAAAASAAAAAGTLANAVKKTGEASQSIAGDIAVSGDLDVGGDADVTGKLDVTGDITGNNASLIGTVTVPTEATGTFTMKAANSTKVKNELDAYSPMVRDTGNKQILGEKNFMNGLLGQSYSGESPYSASNRWYYIEYTGLTTQFLKFWMANYINNGASRVIEGAMLWNGSASSANTVVKVYGPVYGSIGDNIKVTIDTNNIFRTWIYVPSYHTILMNVEAARSWNNNITVNFGYVDNPDWTEYATVKSGVLT